MNYIDEIIPILIKKKKKDAKLELFFFFKQQTLYFYNRGILLLRLIKTKSQGFRKLGCSLR